MQEDDQAVLIFVDIDDFKQINDTYGHKVGDFWIREVAQTLKRLYRHDDIIVRFGGDEYVALIKNTATALLLHKSVRPSCCAS